MLNDVLTVSIFVAEAIGFIALAFFGVKHAKKSQELDAIESGILQRRKSIEAQEKILSKGEDELAKNQKLIAEEKIKIDAQHKDIEQRIKSLDTSATELKKKEDSLHIAERLLKEGHEALDNAKKEFETLKADLENAKVKFDKDVAEFRAKTATQTISKQTSKARK